MPIGSPSELTAQLVVEVSVRDIEKSLRFYTSLGFEVERCDAQFAALRWESSYFFLNQSDAFTLPGRESNANVRVLVPDIHAVWERIQAQGMSITSPLTKQDYGLIDFTVCDPDGFGIRFAQLADQGPALVPDPTGRPKGTIRTHR
jgi:catechol 2,3-dioxygenase-like lactoylglutathione lyase family enzyme